MATIPPTQDCSAIIHTKKLLSIIWDCASSAFSFLIRVLTATSALNNRTARMATITSAQKREPVLPDELLLIVYQEAIPQHLAVEISAANTTELFPKIAANNIEEWSTTRALLSLKPHIIRLIGRHYRFYVSSEMIVRFVNKTSAPAVRYTRDSPVTAPRNVVPSEALARFNFITLVVPVSLVNPLGRTTYRCLGVISMKLETDGDDWWPAFDEFKWTCVTHSNLQVAKDFMAELMVDLTYYLHFNALDGMSTSTQLKLFRVAVETYIDLMNLDLLEPNTVARLQLPPGLRLDSLDEGIARYEKFQADQELWKEIRWEHPEMSVFE